jgi:hypothetical protein
MRFKQGRLGSISKIIAMLAVGCGCSLQAQPSLSDIQGIDPTPPNQVPKWGTFWMTMPDGRFMAPLPCPPTDTTLPIYSLGNDQFIVGPSDSSAIAARMDTMSLASQSLFPPLPGDGVGDGGTPLMQTNAPDIPNYQKFAGQGFLTIDTNDAAINNMDLYIACAAFPSDTNTAPVLQIAHYGPNAVIIKASHFDYSGESDRDFALVVCDKPQTPLWKNVNVSNSTNGQGWLVQGLIDKGTMMDPIFMMVTNVSLTYNTFFRGIPYSGPQVQVSGVQSYDTVSNTLTLQASVTDLSGATNQQLTLTVDGLAARYSVDTNNTILLDTRYTPNGIGTIYVTAGNNSAMLCDPTNAPGDVKLSYANTATLPVDFENKTYLDFPGDSSDPDVQVNYSLFGVTPPQYISGTIYEPVSGRILKAFSCYDLDSTLAELDWNFTEIDGITPYTNDNYVITFTASDSPITDGGSQGNGGSADTLTITNNIERTGVRQAAGTILTYELINDYSYDFQTGLNIGMIDNLLTEVYLCYGLTQYTSGQIGPNRERPDYPAMPWGLDTYNQSGWPSFVSNTVSSGAYSDFNYGPGHANGYMAGGGEYTVPSWNWVNTSIRSDDTHGWVIRGTNGGSTRNWRMRKVEMWGCYTANTMQAGTGGLAGWPNCFGIRPTAVQNSTFIRKNVGLFFLGELRSGGYGSSGSDILATVVNNLNVFWVAGFNTYPGGCDPTYAYGYGVSCAIATYPQLGKANPWVIGYGYLPYAGIYDDQLMMLDKSPVKY